MQNGEVMEDVRALVREATSEATDVGNSIESLASTPQEVQTFKQCEALMQLEEKMAAADDLLHTFAENLSRTKQKLRSASARGLT